MSVIFAVAIASVDTGVDVDVMLNYCVRVSCPDMIMLRGYIWFGGDKCKYGCIMPSTYIALENEFRRRLMDNLVLMQILLIPNTSQTVIRCKQYLANKTQDTQI